MPTVASHADFETPPFETSSSGVEGSRWGRRADTLSNMTSARVCNYSGEGQWTVIACPGRLFLASSRFLVFGAVPTGHHRDGHNHRSPSPSAQHPMVLGVDHASCRAHVIPGVCVGGPNRGMVVRSDPM